MIQYLEGIQDRLKEYLLPEEKVALKEAIKKLKEIDPLAIEAKKVSKLMKSWWDQARSDHRDEALKIVIQNPQIGKDSIKDLPDELVVYKHIAPDFEGHSWTLSKSIAEGFAEESGGEVISDEISKEDILYNTKNSEEEVFLKYDLPEQLTDIWKQATKGKHLT